MTLATDIAHPSQNQRKLSPYFAAQIWLLLQLNKQPLDLLHTNLCLAQKLASSKAVASSHAGILLQYRLLHVIYLRDLHWLCCVPGIPQAHMLIIASSHKAMFLVRAAGYAAYTCPMCLPAHSTSYSTPANKDTPFILDQLLKTSE